MATPRTDRLVSIDALRGIAVLGILMMNVQGFSGPPMGYDNASADLEAGAAASVSVWAIAHTFFAYKFITIFSTLFGAGIVLMAGDGPEKGPHTQRMLWLLLIGAVHAYIFWWGDILVHYALLGLIVVGARRWSVSRLVWTALPLLAVGALLWVGSKFAGAAFATPESTAQNEEMMAGIMAGMTEAFRAGFVDHILWNAGFALMGQIMSFLMIGPRTAGLMLLGMALYKSGFLSASWSYARYGVLSVVGLGVGYYLCNASTQALLAGEFSPQALADGNAYMYPGSLIMSFGYASAVMLLAKIGAFSLIIKLFAATGRMAFTNYLSQTVIMTFIFVGAPGLGLYGTVDRVDQAKLVLLVWALQLAWSPIWLSLFRFGPMEWAWRSLTYRKAQPLLKGKPAEAA
jgi:uncharacterized protein